MTRTTVKLLAAVCVGLAGTASADLVVELRPSEVSNDSMTWTNTGTLGGSFGATNSPTFVADSGVQYAGSTVPGVVFDGGAGPGAADWYTSDMNAPDSLEGNGLRTVEVWILNPAFDDLGEETVVAWGSRGGPDRANQSFNYHVSPDFGSVATWGGGNDAGFEDFSGGPGIPVANQWNHLVWTYDGADFGLYVNGSDEGTFTPAGVLDTAADNPFQLGFQNGGFDGDIGLTATVNMLRIYDEVRTPSQISDAFLEGPDIVGGPSILNLQIDTTSGEATISNPGSDSIGFDYYRILSEDGLEIANWNSLDDQNLDAGGNPDGDFNEDGSTNLADYTVWRDNLGSNSALPNDADLGTPVSQLHYDLWKQSFGSSGGGLGSSWDEAGGSDENELAELFLNGSTIVDGSSAETISLGALFDTISGQQDLVFEYGLVVGNGLTAGTVTYIPAAAISAIPEPSAVTLFLGAVGVFCLTGRFKRSRLVLVVMAFTYSGFHAAHAAIHLDRDYQLGENPLEAGVPGNPVVGISRDSAGSSGTGNLQSFNVVNGNPVYADVSGRPFADGSTVGVSFDGTGDYLARINDPTLIEIFSRGGLGFPGNNPPQNPYDNFAGILERGIQAWVNPTNDNSGSRQDVVNDTYQFGIHISANDNWGTTWGSAFGSTAGFDFESEEPVVFNTWTHVHQHSFGAGSFALYINGVAVEAAGLPAVAYQAHVDGGNLDLTVGAYLDGTNPFTGTIDDVEIYVAGDNTGTDPIADRGDGNPIPQPGMDYGTYNAGVDNDFIASTLAGRPQGDLDLDGDVDDSDVTRFVENWLTTNVVDGFVLGDLVSYGNGDINFDGEINIDDAFLLHEGIQLAGGAGLNFALLQGHAEVPEPGSCALVATPVLIAAFFIRRGRAGSRHVVQRQHT